MMFLSLLIGHLKKKGKVVRKKLKIGLKKKGLKSV